MPPRLALRGGPRAARVTLLWRLLLWALMLACARPACADGPGLLLGRKLVLHPALATELRYDSNIYFSNSRAPDDLPKQSLVLRLVPSLSLATPSGERGQALPGQRAVLRMTGSLDYREFLSPDPLLRVHRMLGGELNAQLALYPQGRLGIDIYDHYQRTTQPPYSVLPYNFNRNVNVFGLRGRHAPGGGRLLSTLLLELGYDGYEDSPGAPRLSDFNVISADLTLRTSWRFLPKTAVFVELKQGLYHYLSANAPLQGRGDSFPLRASLGLMGLVTPRLALQVMGGYGNGFFQVGPSPSTGLLQAEARLTPTRFSAASLSYQHDFRNSVLGSYFDLDSIAGSYSHSVFKIMMSGRVTWARMAFHGTDVLLRNSGVCQNGVIAPCTEQTDRVDNLITVDAHADYPLREWMTAGIGYGLTTNQSNGFTRINNQITSVVFFKHEAWVRATLRY